MKKLLATIFLSLAFFSLFVPQAHAERTLDCGPVKTFPEQVTVRDTAIDIQFVISGEPIKDKYKLRITRIGSESLVKTYDVVPSQNGEINATVGLIREGIDTTKSQPGTYSLNLATIDYFLSAETKVTSECKVDPTFPVSTQVEKFGCDITVPENLTNEIDAIIKADLPASSNTREVAIEKGGVKYPIPGGLINAAPGQTCFVQTSLRNGINIGKLPAGSYHVEIKDRCGIPNVTNCERTFAVGGVDTTIGTTPQPAPCSNRDATGKCLGVETGLGITLSTEPAGFIKSLFSLLLSVAGGIALLLIMYSGYRILTSQGDPKALQGAREQLISAIVGLLFIIFSLVLLEIIGVDILRIPGFWRSHPIEP